MSSSKSFVHHQNCASKTGLDYSVEIDACDNVICGKLFQTSRDGDRKPDGYWSHTLNDAEYNYSASERQFFAVLWTLKTLRRYVIYDKLVVK